MDNKKKMRYLKLGILSFVVIAAVLIVAKQRNAPFQKNTGFVFGTVYNITYQSDKDLQPEIEAELEGGQFAFHFQSKVHYFQNKPQ